MSLPALPIPDRSQPRLSGGGPQRPFLLALRALASVTALLGIFFVAGAAGYRAYLAAPRSPTAVPRPAHHAALAQRAVLFVIDGFNPEHAFDPAVMPALTHLAATGASGTVRTGPVTTTAPCIYSLMTGRPGTLVQAILNFHAREARADSLLSLMTASGRGIVLAGDQSWHRQFGRLAEPEAQFEAPEPGITLDEKVQRFDRQAVDFLLARIPDPRYGMAVVHVGSVDAAGHMVTPHGAAYLEQLRFVDALLAKVAGAVDPGSTVLLVTGDHGMASRGTHGGEEEARHTPYVLAGAGVRRGVVRDVPQTALTATLGVLLGLPFLPVSEHAPLVDLLDVPATRAASLTRDYFTGKLEVAREVEPSVALDVATIGEEENTRLNEVLFGASDSRLPFRAASAGLVALGVVAAATLVRRSSLGASARPPVLGHLALALGAPLAIVLVASTFFTLRARFAYRSSSIAVALIVVVLAGIPFAAWLARRFSALRGFGSRWHLSLFLPGVIALSVPLVNSHWFDPGPYFAVLLLAVAGILGRNGVCSDARARPLFVAPPLFAVAVISSLPPSTGFVDVPLPFPALALAVLAVAFANLRESWSGRVAGAYGLLCALFGAGWAWRLSGGTGTAAVVLALFALAVVAAVAWRRQVMVAATLVITASAGLFLVMANDGHEAGVFLGGAVAALLLARVRLDLSRPAVLYGAAAGAILLRVCLYFALGDQYRLSSIRTVSGFLFSDFGLPLASVVALMLLKYGLPWFLVLGAALPSLAAAETPLVPHFVDLLLLGYVARLAVVGAVVDPLRTLPNAMDGIVGVFCVTWAEFLSFALPATLAVLFTPSAPPAASAR